MADAATTRSQWLDRALAAVAMLLVAAGGVGGPFLAAAGWAHLDGVPPQDYDGANRAAFGMLIVAMLPIALMGSVAGYLVCRALGWSRPAAVTVASTAAVALPAAFLLLLLAR